MPSGRKSGGIHPRSSICNRKQGEMDIHLLKTDRNGAAAQEIMEDFRDRAFCTPIRSTNISEFI